MDAGDQGAGPGRERSQNVHVPVLVADDQQSFRGVMRDVVGRANGFRLVGEAASGEAAIEAVDELAPRFVIMDKRMPGIGGTEACRAITERHPEVVVLLCSVEDVNPKLIRECGAAAVVAKERLSPRVLNEVWRAHGG